MLFIADAPKLQGPVAVYTWEGNQVNITCEVFAYPSATISWFRDGQLLPSSNYSNIKIYNTPSASYLEVSGVAARDRVEKAQFDHRWAPICS